MHIPTTVDLVVNFTFPLQSPAYKVDGASLQITEPDNTILVLDDLLRAAGSIGNAPVLLQPDGSTINTYELLRSLGVSDAQFADAAQQATALNQEFLSCGTNVSEVLDSTFGAEGTERRKMLDMMDSVARDSWLQFSYILPVPLVKTSPRYRARLGMLPESIESGQEIVLPIYFSGQDKADSPLSGFSHPVMFYLVFIPGAENYSLYNFIDWSGLSMAGGQILCKEWEINAQGGCLLKLIVGAGPIEDEYQGHPCLNLKLPLFKTYMKGAMCRITLAAAIGHEIREDEHGESPRFMIEPSYAARVLYSSPGRAAVFCFTAKSLELDPPNLVIRGLNMAGGDIIHITHMLNALGPGARYRFTPQSNHLLLQIEGEKIYRVLLENCSMEDILKYNAVISSDQSLPEWFSYNYLSEQYVREHAVMEADILLTVKSLLNALLRDEDYLSMQTLLNHLSIVDE